MFVDFHCHSDHSDGTNSVAGIIEESLDKRIIALSITDHDTLAGQVEASELSSQMGIRYVKGVEISCDFHETLDILGYGMISSAASIENNLKEVRLKRDLRNTRILSRLRSLGVHIADEELEYSFPGESLGRPHIADLIVKKGYADSIEEAFSRFIGREGRAYVEKEKLSIKAAIELILSAEGIPVLAHPLSMTLDRNRTVEMIRTMRSYGLKGIEVFYKTYDIETRNELLEISKELDLLATGGSDYHGEHKKNLELGIEIPDNFVFRFLESLPSHDRFDNQDL
ncbi:MULTISPECIES: PHP domain-containing protein [unclassified Mesotoga]|uniref:PHP domain-containing protein n=1 Tax=unclassified Mesotoga TaxID=1184398 RepID=UPI000EF1A860|nr:MULTISPECIES: PHP domain-containing protein [unclassified Mesotoga]MDI9368118.1 PHP domain-containing protein [Thermotogota bacterium]MDD3680659.1 PHP domain-containing protein [Mesotoga sp.]MDD4206735.1 PHP domain-containing protein [Mesotoga sp.]MDD5682071.1 PHP domain-containing protein [Mesotoga sp.]RLL87124.1 metal-dependent phosphoesterase [Mesotoga sp. BH458_6_3_2_1]